MRARRSRRAAAIGAASFLAGLGLFVVATPAAQVEAEPPAPAEALARVGQKNADANAMAAERVRREGASAL